MAYMVQPGGHVLGLEKHPELADISIGNIMKKDGELLKSGVLEIRSGNALGGAHSIDNCRQATARCGGYTASVLCACSDLLSMYNCQQATARCDG
jgi:hypothetical protein